MSDFSCRGCGRSLKRGEARYVVSLHVLHDVEVALDPDDFEPPEQYLARLGQMSDRAAADMEAEVYAHEAFFVCGPCRRRLLSEWGTATRPASPPGSAA